MSNITSIGIGITIAMAIGIAIGIWIGSGTPGPVILVDFLTKSLLGARSWSDPMTDRIHPSFVPTRTGFT